MQDRNVEFPNRYRMVKVDGTDDIFDLIPAPGTIYEDGTFRNKANDLTDATAALFGFGSNAVQNDVFSFLGKYNQHWWRRTGYVSAQLIKTPVTNQFFRMTGSAGSSTRIRFSETCTVADDGTISLKNSTTASRKYTDAATIQNEIRGKYFIVSLNNDQDIKITDIYYCDPTATVTSTVNNYYSDPYGITVSSCSSVTGQAEIWGDTEMLLSSYRNAYPDSGEVDGYLYEYLGVPFDNAITAPKSVTGSYIGTGTYGVDNPNSLTFDFKPQIVVITRTVPDSEQAQMGILTANGGMMWSGYYDSDSSGGTYKQPAFYSAISGTTVTWYTRRGEQLNSQSVTYHYVAIG